MVPDASPSSDDGNDYCRICRGEASDEQPLFYPCKCSGSIRYVHQDCLMEWLSHSKKKYCELCKTSFRFTKLYDSSMPATLPLPLFLRQLIYHAVSTFSRWARYTLVSVVWLVCLPWCIRQVWRGLFWLADGSWLSEADVQRFNMGQSTTTRALGAQSTSSLDDHGSTGPHISMLQPVTNDTQSVTDSIRSPSESPWLSFIRFMSGESLISRVFTFLVSLPEFRLGSSSVNVVWSTGNSTSARAPSLLSSFNPVKPFTASAITNDIIIDVLEGLCICFGLVLGFILVFLIREWVINQQPMINVPQHDPQDDRPAVVAVPQNDGRPVLRPRRRRLFPRGIEPIAPAGQAHNAQPELPRTAMPLRRAISDDNIGIPGVAGTQRPQIPARAQSLVPDLDAYQDDQSEHETGAKDPPAPPLVRGAIGDVLTVHRTIEEASDQHDDSPDATALEYPVTGTTSALPLSVAEDSNSHSTPPAQDSLARFGHEVEIGNQPVDQPPPEDLNLDVSTRSNSPAIATPDSSEDGLQSENRQEAEANSTAVTASDEADPAQVEPVTFLQQLAMWLWHVEGVEVGYLQDQRQDSEQIVADLQAEAPFVPVRNGAAIIGHGDDEQPELPPTNNAGQAQAPNVPGPFDPLDPNAVEDAEDLEGLMELIGMEGPLVGMMQNVIFSLFLITVTLTLSIWTPYIWGKIALLLLAHPAIVLVKAPIFLVSSLADLVADICFFALGFSGLLFNNITKMVRSLLQPIVPSVSNLINTTRLDQLALNITHRSGKRLEGTLISTFANLNPDLPTFSLQSHRALLSLKATAANLAGEACGEIVDLYTAVQPSAWSLTALQSRIRAALRLIPELPQKLEAALTICWREVKSVFTTQLKPVPITQSRLSLEALIPEWTTEEMIIAIVLGYFFFALLGFVFLQSARLFLGLKKDDKVEGPIADALRQAGGVMKVVVIIGIEMIVFPLYCGLLLDAALLPLFEGSSISTRLAFIMRAPFTSLFLHWFIGTCYMFHFALFVSMCRKILRKGVLYFIRDPDDPTFHPVRDVLERPVFYQLGKIAFSALVYGGLVIMCLGGVVWGVGLFEGVLPIRWSTAQPRLAFPADVIFFNFMLPLVLRKAEPSKKIAAVYEWWFRGCAHGLRLTNFLFGEEKEEERYSDTIKLPWQRSSHASWVKDGTYARAPAADSCRIPKEQKVFLEVNEENERIDGQEDHDHGLHGKKNDNFVKVYLPPQFKARIATFIILLWLFAASLGVAATLAPLLVGRKAVQLAAGLDTPVNDLYALTMGFHILGASVYAISNAHRPFKWLVDRLQYLSSPGHVLPRVYNSAKYGLGLLYLATAFGVVFPLTLSLLTELYFHIPLFSFLVTSTAVPTAGTPTSTFSTSTRKLGPTVFVLQTWTLGLLYLRLVLRIAANYPSSDTRLAVAIRSITRGGYARPDVKLASRAVIVPLTFACIVLLGFPLVCAKAMVLLLRIEKGEAQLRVFRYAYPAILAMALIMCASLVLKKRLAIWRLKIRDEVYLVGERLHNFVEDRQSSMAAKEKEKLS